MLGLSLIVKNEEKNLTNNFTNFFKEFDSIVVIDTGSIDGTKDLLKNLGVDCICQELDKNNKCSLIEARNKSISLNKEDWILVLDADETISLEDIKIIKEILRNQKHDSKIGGFFIPFMDYRYGTPFLDYKLCLLKKNNFFEGYVHANPQSVLRKKGLIAKIIENIEIRHYPSNYSKEKIGLYIEQMIFGLEKERNNARYLWFLGYSFYKHDDIKEAELHLGYALDLLSNDHPVESLNAGMVLTYLLLKDGNFDAAEKVVDKTLEFREFMKNDFEVKINFRLKKTLLDLKQKIQNKDNNGEIYLFVY